MDIIINPDEALEMARSNLKARQNKSEKSELSSLKVKVYKKQIEWERLVTALHKGITTINDAEKEMKMITAEQSRLEREIQDIQTQAALCQAFEDQINAAQYVLELGRSVIHDIESDNDRLKIQELIRALVSEILCYTSGTGRQKTFRLRVHFRLG